MYTVHDSLCLPVFVFDRSDSVGQTQSAVQGMPMATELTFGMPKWPDGMFPKPDPPPYRSDIIIENAMFVPVEIDQAQKVPGVAMHGSLFWTCIYVYPRKTVVFGQPTSTRCVQTIDSKVRS